MSGGFCDGGGDDDDDDEVADGGYLLPSHHPWNHLLLVKWSDCELDCVNGWQTFDFDDGGDDEVDEEMLQVHCNVTHFASGPLEHF